jgi:hypothetical protein
MMRVSSGLVLVVLLVAANCLVSAESQEVPSLVGTWTGTCVGHDQKDGYFDASEWSLELEVTEQKDRVFNGKITFIQKSDNKVLGDEGFSGVIGPDMKTIYLGEYDSGFSFGQLLDPDTLEFIYLDDGKNGSAGIDTFTRVKA